MPHPKRDLLSPRTLLVLVLGGTVVAASTALVMAQRPRTEVGQQPDGTVLVPSNQTLTPIGTVHLTEGIRPKDVALSPDGRQVAVLTTARLLLFNVEGAKLSEATVRPGPLGLAWAPDGKTVYASGAGGQVHPVKVEGDKLAAGQSFPVDVPNAQPAKGARSAGDSQPTGLAVSPDGRRLYVALGIRNQVLVRDLTTAATVRAVPVGVAPYQMALSPDGSTLVAANRGGHRAGEDDVAEGETAPSADTPVLIDKKTDAAREGSVTLIDTASFATREVKVGKHPAGMAFSTDGRTLYVANSDSDTVSVLDVRKGQVRRTIGIRPPEDPGFGQIPTDVALSADGKTLFVTCGGGNSVALVETSDRARLRGFLPAGWYPIGLAERDGRLVVASAKGIGARPSNKGRGYGVHNSVGTVQFIAPDAYRDLADLTRRVAENNRWGKEREARKGIAPVPIPERVGEPSVFKHVVYIIKENHTYDLTLGDMKEGNGDPSLTLFGEEVTPNQHALARQWVLLDNTYTSGTNSADGHQWSTSSVANGYIEQNYAAHARSYPYDGGDPLAYSPEGFLWNAAVKKGHWVRVFGEFVNKPKIVDPATGKGGNWTQLWQDYKAGTNRFQITADTDNAALKPLLHPRFIGFPSTVSDQWRADQFLGDLKEWERTGKMPSLSIMLLPNDHTAGNRPGMPTPRAAVADNDLATGRIIDALSHSRFWKDTLILVIQDDSQLGLDHVDGHRTLAYCVSPYTRRGVVVSENYNHTSFLRTMELVLGIPAMTRFERTALPLTACFTDKPDLRPFIHHKNRIPLDEMNRPANALTGEARRLAIACDRLDWSDVDRADASIVSRAVWITCRPQQPFPWNKYHPIEDEDDDEEEEREAE